MQYCFVLPISFTIKNPEYIIYLKIYNAQVRRNTEIFVEALYIKDIKLYALPNDFYAPPQKVAGYYVIPSDLLSVCPSVCPSVRPSAVEHPCPVHNFDTVRDNFTKLGTNVKHDQRLQRLTTVTPPTFFAELFPFEIFGIEIVSAL